MVIGVDGEPPVWLGIIERLAQKNFVDGLRGGLGAARSGQVLA
jgi:hypothetical protein